MDKSQNTEAREELKNSFKSHPRATRIIFSTMAVLFVLMLIWAIVSLVLLFFSVKTITVVGGEPYSSAEIIEASGIEEGDRLYYLFADKKEKNLISNLPHIKNSEIKAYFPSKVEIKVECYDKIFVTEGNEGSVYMSEGFSLLKNDESIQRAAVSDALYLYLSEKLSVNDGKIEDFAEKKELAELLTVLKKSGLLEKTQIIFFRNTYDITVVTENCIIELGNLQSLQEKLLLFERILRVENLSEEDYAKVNVSNVKEGIFRPLDTASFAKEIEFYKQ